MPRHVLVDGFNVIRRDAELANIERINFQGARAALVSKLAGYRRYTSHQITVVFDGGKGQSLTRHRLQQEGIQIIYSGQGETADEVIVDLLARDSGSRSAYLVITADQGLAAACRNLRVDVAQPDELMRRSRPRSAIRTQPEVWLGKREEKSWIGHTRKKGNPRRPPKNKRQARGLW